jgi:endo-1,4-beta-mannosidase
LNTIPAIYHATAETIYYRGVSGRPAFIEEIGAFGPGYLSEKRTDDYLYTTLYSAMVHGFGSVLWWCGFSFDRCADTQPYRWGAMERELGALKSDRSMDGAAKAMKRFADEIKELPEILPPREVDAMVVLSTLDEPWKTAYGSFILSKQAGFEIEFCNIASIDELPESKFYIVPSISGYEVMDVHKYRLLLAAAEKGATVVFTADSGFLQPFNGYFGCEVDYRTQSPETTVFTLDGKEYAVDQTITRRMYLTDGKLIAADSDGNPVIVEKNYGAGKLVFVNAALENSALNPGNELYKVYRKLAEIAGLTLPEKSPETGITRHILSNGKVLTFYINYADYEVDGMPGNSVKYSMA